MYEKIRSKLIKHKKILGVGIVAIGIVAFLIHSAITGKLIVGSAASFIPGREYHLRVGDWMVLHNINFTYLGFNKGEWYTSGIKIKVDSDIYEYSTRYDFKNEMIAIKDLTLYVIEANNIEMVFKDITD